MASKPNFSEIREQALRAIIKHVGDVVSAEDDKLLFRYRKIALLRLHQNGYYLQGVKHSVYKIGPVVDISVVRDFKRTGVNAEDEVSVRLTESKKTLTLDQLDKFKTLTDSCKSSRASTEEQKQELLKQLLGVGCVNQGPDQHAGYNIPVGDNLVFPGPHFSLSMYLGPEKVVVSSSDASHFSHDLYEMLLRTTIGKDSGHGRYRENQTDVSYAEALTLVPLLSRISRSGIPLGLVLNSMLEMSTGSEEDKAALAVRVDLAVERGLFIPDPNCVDLEDSKTEEAATT